MFNLKKVTDNQQFRQFISEHSQEMEEGLSKRSDITGNYLSLIRLLANINHSLLTFNNTVKILENGPDTFQAIFEACRQAKKFIHLQYYIFIDGDLVDQFAEIFRERIENGVEVRIIYDHLGSWELSDPSIKKLQALGVKLYPFMPLRFGSLARVNYRNHRKILIVDGEVGFTGGINVDDKYIYEDPLLGHWEDTHLRLQGMSVNYLHFVFLCDWYFVSGEDLIRPEMYKTLPLVGDTPVQIVASGPDTDYPSILQQYLLIIAQAKEYLFIANPYIVPDASLKIAITTAALSGVDVRMVIPENSDSAVIKWTVRSYFTEYLKAGVKIYMYQKGFLHSKIILSDDAVCSIGTANLDIRSFEQNFEVNALIYERDTTLELKRHFHQFLEDSQLIDPQMHSKRPNVEIVKENLARLASPLM